MCPNLEFLEARNLCDIAPLAPGLPLIGPVGGVRPPSYMGVPLAPPLVPTQPSLLSPADPVRLQLGIEPINLNLGLVPLAPPVLPFPGGVAR